MTRSGSRRASLEGQGAQAVIADALEARAVERAVREAEPEGMVSLLTSLPRTGPRRLRDLEPTNRLREEGTRNLVNAAVAAGARRFLGDRPARVGRESSESIIAIYGYGPRATPATEDDPPARESHAGVQRAVEAAATGERHVKAATEAGDIEGVSVRFGFYHGPRAPNSRFMLRMARRRMLPLIGGGHAVHSWIELADAATAVADCLERGRPASVYNVVDDEPVELATTSPSWHASAGGSRRSTSPTGSPASPCHTRPSSSHGRSSPPRTKGSSETSAGDRSARPIARPSLPSSPGNSPSTRSLRRPPRLSSRAPAANGLASLRVRRHREASRGERLSPSSREASATR